jgi:hypothetical protein
MTNDSDDVAGETQLEPEVLRMLELLERLAGGERLTDAPIAMGLSQDDARSIFAKAGVIVRRTLETAPKHWPAKGTLLDWREMTVVEALEILGDLPNKQSGQEG